MTTSSAETLSALDRAHEVVPVLAEHAAETEAARRVHHASLAAVRDARFFALPVPQRFGGGGAGVAEMARVLVEVGRGFPSTSWVLGTSAASKSFATCSFGGDVLAEIFAEVDTMSCGSGKPGGAAVSTLGGFRITGRWDYVSGVEDAAVAGLGVMLPGKDGDDAQATFGQALAPIDELTIDKTWDTAGLRGTGSHTLIAEDLFVPAERANAVEFSSSFVLASTAYVLGPILGAALGALDETERLFASGGNRLGSAYDTIAQSPGAQHLLTEATRLVEDAVDRTLTWCAAVDNGAKDALAALERMVDLHGTKGMATAHLVQRFWRDASVGARHVLLNQFMIEEEYGKLLATGRRSWCRVKQR
jgi:alkylation response protein AidB-like acyl-CoA dehydrogenase